MSTLFPTEKIIFDLPQAEIEYHPHFFDAEKADLLFQKLQSETPWQHDNITVFGKSHRTRRQQGWYFNATQAIQPDV